MKNLSKEEVKALYDRQELTDYEKSSIVAWRLSIPGETLVVICGGKIETILHSLDPTQIVVKNISIGASAEEYAIDETQFNKKYDPLSNKFAMNIDGRRWDRAQAKGKVKGFEYEGEDITFEAPWGGPMLCEDGDMLVGNAEGEIYRIAKNEFDVTYKESK